jgi:hypothetical protein
MQPYPDLEKLVDLQTKIMRDYSEYLKALQSLALNPLEQSPSWLTQHQESIRDIASSIYDASEAIKKTLFPNS